MTKNDGARTKSRARTGAEPDSETREVEITWAVLASLFQLRISTARQLRQLHAPDSGIEKMRGRLRRLRVEGLAEELVLPQSGRTKGWFPTEHGVRIAGAFPELADIPAPRLPGDETAFKYTLWHQLAVVRAHLAFLADARKRGDVYGAFDFIPEITHRFAEGKEGSVRPDGLLHYAREAGDGARVSGLAFVELDRGTMGGTRLAAKLNAYARYWATAPLPAGVRPGTTEGGDLAVAGGVGDAFVLPVLAVPVVLGGRPPHTPAAESNRRPR
ncbi:replication-relaxation family protein [Kitasatospora sp. NPDC004669]|uniref:replication-relaxation family protein n=1 Tax=Kitasatospora sp. NPDC004669 TaxID=3154555 RepID=UPI0033B9D046